MNIDINGITNTTPDVRPPKQFTEIPNETSASPDSTSSKKRGRSSTDSNYESDSSKKNRSSHHAS